MRIGIVTGASSGMGRLFVKQMEFFYKGLDEIWVIARRKERMEELSTVMMTKLRIFVGDLTDDKFLKQFKEHLQEENPDIRMLVNAAGFGKLGEISELDCRTQLNMIELNCKTLVHMTIECIPFMSKGSRLINIASAAAFCPQPYFSVYAASKSFVLSFTNGIREELREKGIIVMAVCPGPVKTEFFDIAGSKKGVLKDRFMARPEAVVKKAFIDAKKGKETSVYGILMNFCRYGAKIVPHTVITKMIKCIWKKG